MTDLLRTRPPSLPLVPSGQTAVAGGWRGPAVPPGPSTVLEMLRDQVQEAPDAVALDLARGDSVSYAALAAWVDATALLLAREGVGPGTVVGVSCERGDPVLIVTLLAAQSLGGIHLPIDPGYPAVRQAFILEDSRAQLVIGARARTDGSRCLDRDDVAALRHTDAPRAPFPEPSAGAYLIYTSGSTGTPKGVLVSHAAWASLTRSARHTFALGTSDRVLQLFSPSFDGSMAEIALALASGAALVLRRAQDLLPGLPLQNTLAEARITWVISTPSLFATVEAIQLPALRHVLFGGEFVPYTLVQRWLAPMRQVIIAYGPTESAVWVSLGQVDPCDPSPHMGGPVAGVTLVVLADNDEPVPIGDVGELYIGGTQLADGYRDQPGLTAERFRTIRGERLYRTGDLVRFREEGVLDFVGRVDDQVKVRGVRIELGEVEAALAGCTDVAAAAVAVRETSTGVRRLVGYVVARPGAAPTVSGLLAELRDQLPAAIVPATVVLAAELPLTPNGKVDRQLLPDPGPARPELATPYSAPRTPLEQAMVDALRVVLGIDGVGIDDDFHEFGGESLVATRVATRFADRTGLDLTIATVLGFATVRRIAEEVLMTALAGSSIGDRLPSLPLEKRVLLERKLLSMRAADPERQRIRRRPPSTVVPLSFAQQRLWFLDQLEGGSSTYNAVLVQRLDGPLDADAFGRACDALVARHESLRTVFPDTDGVPRQEILESASSGFGVVEMTAADEDSVLAAVVERARARFDLERDCLLRATLFRIRPDRSIVALVCHHIASDGWSRGVIFDDLSELYAAEVEGRPSRLPELAIQYADYAVWQREHVAGEVLDRQVEHWKQALAGAPTRLALPTDKPRPPRQHFRGAHFGFAVDDAVAAAVSILARSEGATLFMALLAAFGVVLSCRTGQDDVLLGSPIANRHRAEIEPLIGFFVNTLVMRVSVSGDPSYRDVVRRVKPMATGAFAHQDVPFEQVVDAIGAPRDPSRNPLFQCNFRVQGAATPPLVLLGGVLATPLEVDLGAARFDLAMELRSDGERMDGYLEYNLELFAESTAAGLVHDFLASLSALVASPDAPLSTLDLPRRRVPPTAKAWG